jgi:transposase
MLPSTESIFSEIENLKIQVHSLLSQVEKERETKKIFEEENSKLLEIIRDLKRMKFGKKSERWVSSEQMVFNEAEVEFRKPDSSEEAESAEISVKEHTKKVRGHRKALPENLEREEILVELPESERFSEDGTPLKIIGYEISEKLSYEPSKTKVIVYRRARYGVDSGDYVKTAPPVPSIIPKGIATSELLTSIVVEKYGYGMPLFRQEYKFNQMGVDLTRQTMARWVIQSADALMPVWNVLCERLLASHYISCDETHTQVLKENGKSAESKSWMWVRCMPIGKNKVILFDYDPHRSSEVAKKLLDEFKGFLQVDGYASYNVLEKNSGLIRIGCNMHGRRYFEKANTIGAKSGKSLAEVGLRFYKQLYDHEAESKNFSTEDRYRHRQETQVPIWKRFKSWVEENSQKVPPKSKIGEAFKYFLSEYEYLIGYLQDGSLEMDNGFAERAIRKFAIGRNNWMFADTEAGAHASAMFYSMLCTAKVNDVNIFEAMNYLFTEVPKAQFIEDFERLADVIMGIMPIPGK